VQHTTVDSDDFWEQHKPAPPKPPINFFPTTVELYVIGTLISHVLFGMMPIHTSMMALFAFAPFFLIMMCFAIPEFFGHRRPMQLIMHLLMSSLPAVPCLMYAWLLAPKLR